MACSLKVTQRLPKSLRQWKHQSHLTKSSYLNVFECQTRWIALCWPRVDQLLDKRQVAENVDCSWIGGMLMCGSSKKNFCYQDDWELVDVSSVHLTSNPRTWKIESHTGELHQRLSSGVSLKILIRDSSSRVSPESLVEEFLWRVSLASSTGDFHCQVSLLNSIGERLSVRVHREA